jgi:6-phosphofructokinase 2
MSCEKHASPASSDRIATITLNPAIDKSCAVNRVTVDKKLRCSAPRREAGGGGINVSKALLALGRGAHTLWSRGGHTGEHLAWLLEEAGLSQVPVSVSGTTRENLVVYEESSSEQFRFGMPGPELGAAEAKQWIDTVAGLSPPPAHLVMSGSLPPGLDDDFYARLVEATAEPTRVVLDTSGGPLCAALEVGVHAIKPNLRELGQIAGRDMESDEDIARAVSQIRKRGQAEVVFVSMGQSGAFVSSPEGSEHVRSPMVKVRNRVGAGDSMVAGLVLRLTDGGSPSEAALYGVAAGAAAVMRESTGLCRREDVERLMSKMK